MNRLTLTMASTEYDHTRDLVTGAVPIEGIDPIWLQLPIEEIFYRFLKHREFDVSEVSMAKYCSLVASGDTSLVAIPVFPSRVFRHSSVFVRADSDVRRPEDLAGRRIGVPEWAQTASVYSRGFLAHQYGVDLRSVQWVQAGVNEPGRREKVRLHLPQGITCTPVPDRSLNDMLLAGDLDAVLSARPPSASAPADGRLVRLFADSRTEEREYVAKTGVFPIMHTVAIRREVVDAHPWVPMSLFKAFSAARDNSIDRVLDSAVARVPVPWFREFATEVWDFIGGEPWPYGVEANATTLDTFLQYAHEQGVCERRLAPADLFAPQVDAGYKV
jgi:4,5-dihydroxyphthalate decarboxylase